MIYQLCLILTMLNEKFGGKILPNEIRGAILWPSAMPNRDLPKFWFRDIFCIPDIADYSNRNNPKLLPTLFPPEPTTHCPSHFKAFNCCSKFKLSLPFSSLGKEAIWS